MNKRNLLRSYNMCIGMEMRVIKVYVWRAAPYFYEAWLLNEAEQNLLESFVRCSVGEKLRELVEKNLEQMIGMLSFINETRKILNTNHVKRCNVMEHAHEYVYFHRNRRGDKKTKETGGNQEYQI